jgi:hypothetical protein
MEAAMPTVDEYRGMLNRAIEANDQPAVQYFQSQIGKAEAQPKPEAKAVPQGGSILSPLTQGATFGFADEIGGGVRGLYDVVTGKGTFKEGYEKTRDDLRESASQYAERNPVTSFLTELIAGAALPGAGARTLARGAMLGAGAGAATGVGKNENPDNLGADVALGAGLGGAGGAAGQAASGLYRAIFPRRTPRAQGRDYQDDVGRLRSSGIDTTPGERLGNPAAVKAERQTQAYLGSGEELASRPNQLRSQIMARGGFDADDVNSGELSDQAVQRAKDRFNREYSSTLANTHVDLGDMDPRLAAVEQRFNRTLLDHEQKREVRQVLDSFRDEISRHQNVTGSGNISTVIPGEAYKRLRSDLGKESRRLAKQTGARASLAPIYRDIQGALDDAFRANAPTDIARRLSDLDSEYRHFAFLRDAAQNPHNIDQIANRIMQSSADDDLKALARAYQNVIVRGGGNASMPDPSGALMPPLMSMMRSGGAAITERMPDMPNMLPPGTKTSIWGQGSGMVGQKLAETGNDEKRKAKRRKKFNRARREEADQYGSY